jgi:hypothetical protein
MWITKLHLGTIMALCFGLGGLVCAALPTAVRDIIQWRQDFGEELKQVKGDER